MRRPALTLALVSLWTLGGLRADAAVGRPGQLALGALTAVLLGLLLHLQEPALRAQTVGVVAVATVGEVVGSLLWGVYEYRLGNLPAFVPPGHGLVYLAGASLGALAGRHVKLLVATALAGSAGWGLAGLLLLPQADAAGAIGCALLVLVLARNALAGVRGGVPGRRGARAVRDCARHNGPGGRTCPGSGCPRATRRVARRAATSSSTPWRPRS